VGDKYVGWERRVAFAVAVVCAVGGLAFLAHALLARPYGTVEAELVFEASRIARRLPLYVDPYDGAWDAGPPPSRYYVLYTPIWPWVLAHLPGPAPPTLDSLRTGGRLLNAVLCVVTLGALVRASAPDNRLSVATGACLALGFSALAREAGLATADMPAVALSSIGLARLAHKGRLDALSAAALAAAPLVKPSVLGGAAGAYAAHAIANRRSGARPLAEPVAVGALVAGAMAALYHVWSDGQWLVHIARATGQTLSFERWVREFGGRAALLGAPHLAVLVLAIRRRARLTATLPLATSVVWASFAMAKHGSGTHYWLEPTVAALVTLGIMPVAGATTSPSDRTARPWIAWAGLALALAVATESLPAFWHAPAEDCTARRRVEAIRRRCRLRGGQVLVSDDPALELAIDGRIIVPVWQNSYLVRAGTFPLQAWREDLARPEVAWFVHDAAFLQPAPEHIAGITEVNAFRRELRDTIEENFELAPSTESIDAGAGLLVFQRRGGP
jgi:hypothetical protein